MVFRAGWLRVRDTWWPTLPTILEDEELGCRSLRAGHWHKKFLLNDAPMSITYARYTLKRQRPDDASERRARMRTAAP